MSGWDAIEGRPRPRAVTIGGTDVHAGDTVRLWPRGGADALDRFLWGRRATVLSIEEDYEGVVHLAVTVDDDPGADFGAAGQVGHRFFFKPDEVELIAPDTGRTGEEAP